MPKGTGITGLGFHLIYNFQSNRLTIWQVGNLLVDVCQPNENFMDRHNSDVLSLVPALGENWQYNEQIALVLAGNFARAM